MIPKDAIETKREGATVPFYLYQEDDVTVYQFDSSRCGHPEPMINAMTGLQSLQENEKLIMINSKAPMGLFPKVENDFNFEVEDLEDGRVKVTFTKKAKGDATTNFTDTGCAGGGCSN